MVLEPCATTGMRGCPTSLPDTAFSYRIPRHGSPEEAGPSESLRGSGKLRANRLSQGLYQSFWEIETIVALGFSRNTFFTPW